MRRRILVAMLLALASGGRADAEPRPVLRVATSGDYAPFSSAQAGEGGAWQPAGLDAALARAYAADRDLEIEWHRLRWPELLQDLASHRFDVAMSGISVRPERSLAGLFSVPIATSGAVVLVRADLMRASAGLSQVDWLDRPGVRISVNAGGHLERVARTRFPSAQITAHASNVEVPLALVSGEADAAVSDSLEAPFWMAGHPGLVLLGPFTRDRKAYLMPADSDRLAADLDAWLLAREADGSLERLRRETLGAAAAASADQAAPLRALLASIDERLSLMPLVAEAKARLGLPVEDSERESRVLAAAVAGARGARCPAPLPGASQRPLEAESVRGFFQAQIDAARAIQHAELAKRSPPPHAADAADSASQARQDLDSRLRPALLRIGARMTRLLACLPEDLDAAAVEAAAQVELGAGDLPGSQRSAIADAIVRVARRGAPQQPPQ